MFWRIGIILICTLCAYAIICPDQEYNLDEKRCCAKCAPGEGVRRDCTHENNTYCEPCIQDRTYSPHISHTERCRQCRQCGPNAILRQKCTVTQDTICECNQDYYFDENSGGCKKCDECPAGFGVVSVCTKTRNTQCQSCKNGTTYSENRSLYMKCVECSTCQKDETKIQICSADRNTICLPKLGILRPRTTKGPETSSNTGAELIPLYCAIMGLVVVALLAYAIYKHWKLRGKKRRAAYLEKQEAARRTGSDSGVYVDQESKLYNNCTKIRDLPANKKKELEVVLTRDKDGQNWTHLAKELGYNSTKIESFKTHCQGDEEKGVDTESEGQTPVRYMLLEWGENDTATIGHLVRALKNVGRQDVLKVLQGEQQQKNHDLPNV